MTEIIIIIVGSFLVGALAGSLATIVTLAVVWAGRLEDEKFEEEYDTGPGEPVTYLTREQWAAGQIIRPHVRRVK